MRNAGENILLVEGKYGTHIKAFTRIEAKRPKGCEIAHRTFYWLNYKDRQGCLFQLPETLLKWSMEDGFAVVDNRGEYPAVGVYFECPEVSNVFRAEDSFFWLDPGEKRNIKINSPGIVKTKAWNSI